MAKEFQYVVRGHWPFPADMLRYDGSRAASADDQAKIDRLSSEFAHNRDAFKEVDIELIGRSKPNTARWESFGWSVPSDVEHVLFKRLAQQRCDDERLFQSALAKLSDAERRVVMSKAQPHGGSDGY